MEKLLNEPAFIIGISILLLVFVASLIFVLRTASKNKKILKQIEEENKKKNYGLYGG